MIENKERQEREREMEMELEDMIGYQIRNGSRSMEYFDAYVDLLCIYNEGHLPFYCTPDGMWCASNMEIANNLCREE